MLRTYVVQQPAQQQQQQQRSSLPRASNSSWYVGRGWCAQAASVRARLRCACAYTPIVRRSRHKPTRSARATHAKPPLPCGWAPPVQHDALGYTVRRAVHRGGQRRVHELYHHPGREHGWINHYFILGRQRRALRRCVGEGGNGGLTAAAVLHRCTSSNYV